MVTHQQRIAPRLGLTLIELLIVMVILAATAALVIPRLGFIQGQASNATSAAGAADLFSNLETFKVSTGAYPSNLDSLLDGSGSLITTLFTHPGGFPAIPISAGTVGTTATERQSLGHAFGVYMGYPVMDHVANPSDPSSSGTALRSWVGGATGNAVAVIAPVAANASYWQAAGFNLGSGVDEDENPITIFPPGVKLIAFGVGPRCTLMGKTMTNTPRHVSQSLDKYGRFIAVFAVYGDTGDAKAGKGTELKMVLDSNYTRIDDNILSFKKSATN